MPLACDDWRSLAPARAAVIDSAEAPSSRLLYLIRTNKSVIQSLESRVRPSLGHVRRSNTPTPVAARRYTWPASKLFNFGQFDH